MKFIYFLGGKIITNLVEVSSSDNGKYQFTGIRF
jgi:hypothetical protein